MTGNDPSVLTDLSGLGGVLAFYGTLFLVGSALLMVWGWHFYHRPSAWRTKGRRLLWRPWSLVDVTQLVLILLVLHLVVFAALQIALRIGWLHDDGDVQHAWLVGHSLALHWAALVVIALCASRRGISWQVGFTHPGWSWRQGLSWGALVYVATIPVLLTYAALYSVWLQWTGYEPRHQDVVALFASLEGGWLYYYLILLAVVVAPISEELLFRGIALPALGRRIGLGAAVVLHSILFALMHYHVPSLVPLFVLSIMLSLAYIYTENIIVPIVAHMIFNAVSLMVLTALNQ